VEDDINSLSMNQFGKKYNVMRQEIYIANDKPVLFFPGEKDVESHKPLSMMMLSSMSSELSEGYLQFVTCTFFQPYSSNPCKSYSLGIWSLFCDNAPTEHQKIKMPQGALKKQTPSSKSGRYVIDSFSDPSL
jgi:hypothetical protein